MKDHLSEMSSGNKKWLDGCFKVHVTHLHNLAGRLYYLNVLHMLFAERGLRSKQSASADYICSAAEKTRSPGGCPRCQVASLRPVLGYPDGSAWSGGGGGRHTVHISTLWFTVGHFHPANSHDIGPPPSTAPPDVSPLRVHPLPCIVPFRRAKCESHIFSRPFVSQCKLICVDKRRRSSAVGGLVRPRGSVCVRHAPQRACRPGTGGGGWVGGWVGVSSDVNEAACINAQCINACRLPLPCISQY